MLTYLVSRGAVQTKEVGTLARVSGCSHGLEKTQVCAAVDNQDLNLAVLAPGDWRNLVKVDQSRLFNRIFPFLIAIKVN